MINYDILSKMSESELRRLIGKYSDEMDAMSNLIQAQGDRIADLERTNASLKKLFRCVTKRGDCKRATLDFTHELISKYAQTVNTSEDATEDKEAKDDRI